MKKYLYILLVLVVPFFLSCTDNKNLENIYITVENKSNKIVNNFCLTHSNGISCIKEISPNKKKKMKISIFADSSLNMTYSLSGKRIYDNYDIGTYLTYFVYGYFNFFIENNTISINKKFFSSKKELDSNYTKNEKEFILNKK